MAMKKEQASTTTLLSVIGQAPTYRRHVLFSISHAMVPPL